MREGQALPHWVRQVLSKFHCWILHKEAWISELWDSELQMKDSGPVAYRFVRHHGRHYSSQELRNSRRLLLKGFSSGWRPTKSDHIGYYRPGKSAYNKFLR